MRESKIEGRVKTWARSKGILPLKMSPVGTAGYPDDVFLHAGRCVFIEFKSSTGRLRPLQDVRIAELQRLGYPTAVVRTVDEGVEFLEANLLGGA